MGRLSRWLLVAVLLGSSSCASDGGESAENKLGPPSGEAWSDPATWPSNRVPTEGDDVVIPSGKRILLDVSPPNLSTLTVDGTLVFDDRDLELTVGSIHVAGELRIGSEERLHQHRATVTLTSGATGDDASSGTGTRGIMVMGGRLELHARAPEVTWTKLGDHAEANATSLTLLGDVDWEPNDDIVVAPTDFYRLGRTALHSVASVDGATVELAEPLEQFRWGKLQYVDESGVTLEPTDAVTESVIDERAEVGNLTRKILIQGPDDDLWKNERFGAHVMIMTGSQARIEGVEFRRVGQAGILARYPIHWHLMSYTSDGEERTDQSPQYIRNSSIWNSSQRCVVLHGTNDVAVQNNICFDIRGHAIFLEDAVERRNVIEDNLVLHVHRPDPGQRLLNHDDKAAGFWLTNPDNVVRGNVAADAEGIGFWLAFPEHSLGSSANVPLEPTFLPFGTFDDNTAHSNGIVGFMFDEAPRNEVGDIVDLTYRPSTGGEGTESVPFTMTGIRLYKHEAAWETDRASFWNRAVGPRFREFVISDFNGTAFSGASICEISQALVVGRSLNEANQPLLPGGELLFLSGASPLGAASYHSDCDIFENVFVNLPAIPNRPSGAFATNDYYITGVDKGLSRNPDNRFINTHPGFRAPSPHTLAIGEGRENWALAGALWDEHGYWGTPGNYWVYDMPFLTDGTPCSEPLEPHRNDRSCVGPYYGVNRISLDGLEEWDPSQNRPLHVRRVDNDTTWFIDDGNCTSFLGNMRHFSAVRGGHYEVTFPPGQTNGDDRNGTPGDQIDCAAGLSSGSPTPTKVQFRVTNLFEAEDEFLLGIAYSSAVVPTVYATVRQSPLEVTNWAGYLAWKQGSDWQGLTNADLWYPLTQVSSAEEVVTSAGDVFYQDAANNQILLKVSRQDMTFLQDYTTPNYRLYHDVTYVIRDDI